MSDTVFKNDFVTQKENSEQHQAELDLSQSSVPRRGSNIKMIAALLSASVIQSATRPDATVAQEPQSRPVDTNPLDTKVLPAVHERSSQYEQGFARGFQAGQLSVLSESLKADISKIDEAMKQHATAEERTQWSKDQRQIQTRLANVSAALESPTAENFDFKAALKDLQGDLQAINTYGLLVKRMQPQTAPGTSSSGQSPLIPGEITLKHGDIISLQLFDKLYKPLVEPMFDQIIDQFNKKGGVDLQGMKQSGAQEEPAGKTSIPTTQNPLQGILDQFKQGLKNDVEKIKQQRARDK